MAGTTVPDLTLKDPVVAQDIVYITDAVNDFKTTLSRILTYINANLTNLTEAQISLADNTTNNSSTTKHGFVPKLPNDNSKFLDGTGSFTTPSGITNSAGASVIPKSDGINLVASRITEDEELLELGNDAGAGNKISINNASGIISLGIVGGTLFEIDTNNFKITSTKPIRINNNVVLQDINGDRLLTTQQEGVADASILLSSVVTQFNTLLARLRTHGLIKT